MRLKRAYEPPEPEDGTRILVDRLWPRGIKKADAALAVWTKDLAPSPELRRWFGHDPTRWEEFCARYRRELADSAATLDEIRALARTGSVTLLFAAREPTYNHARILRDVIIGK